MAAVSSSTLVRYWKELEFIVEYKWPKSAKQRFIQDYGEKGLREVLSHAERYIEAFPQELGASDVPATLMRMLEAGDWPPPAQATKAGAEGGIVRPQIVRPVGLSNDPLLAELPPLVQAMAEDRIEGTNVCLDFAIAGAIAQLAALAGNQVRFKAWGDERLCNLYLILVGEAGSSHKSSVARWAKRVIGDVDHKALAPDEGSVEALIRSLSEYPSRLWIRDEFAGLLASMKGQDYMRPVRELLMSLYDHLGVYRRYLMRATYTCTNPALTFLATIQPSVLGEELFSGRNVDSGFVSRLILVWGGSCDRWPTVALEREMILSSLRMLSSQAGTLRLSAVHAADLAGAEQDVALAEPHGQWLAGRFAAHALKIATLLAWARGEKTDVRDEDIYPAMSLLRRWNKQMSEVIDEIHIKTPGERQRRDVFGFICKRSHNGTGPPGKGEIAEWAHVGKRDATALGDDLEDRGWVSEADDGKLQCTKRSYLCLQRVK